MIQKLKSNAGETITEVLVASLVVVLGVLLYTMMVQSSFRIITKSEDKMQKIYAAESIFEQGTASGSSVEVAFNTISGISSPGDVSGAKKVKVYVSDAENIKAYTYNKPVNP